MVVDHAAKRGPLHSPSTTKARYAGERSPPRKRMPCAQLTVPSRQSTSRLSDASCATSSPRLRSSRPQARCVVPHCPSCRRSAARALQSARAPAGRASPAHRAPVAHALQATFEHERGDKRRERRKQQRLELSGVVGHRWPPLSPVGIRCARPVLLRARCLAPLALCRSSCAAKHGLLPARQAAVPERRSPGHLWCGRCGPGGRRESGGAPLGAGEQQDLQRILFFVLP